jgi:hypothetical protein
MGPPSVAEAPPELADAAWGLGYSGPDIYGSPAPTTSRNHSLSSALLDGVTPATALSTGMAPAPLAWQDAEYDGRPKSRGTHTASPMPLKSAGAAPISDTLCAIGRAVKAALTPGSSRALAPAAESPDAAVALAAIACRLGSAISSEDAQVSTPGMLATDALEPRVRCTRFEPAAIACMSCRARGSKWAAQAGGGDG